MPVSRTFRWSRSVGRWAREGGRHEAGAPHPSAGRGASPTRPREGSATERRGEGRLERRAGGVRTVPLNRRPSRRSSKLAKGEKGGSGPWKGVDDAAVD